jgi:hypothetical protein
MPAKQFKIPAAKLKPLAPSRGACYATDSITVDGNKVNYMYREAPDFPEDSGWRFFSGKESAEQIDDPDYFQIYDVNTIANYDPDIIPFLDVPPNSAFERSDFLKKFKPVPFSPPEE